MTSNFQDTRLWLGHSDPKRTQRYFERSPRAGVPHQPRRCGGGPSATATDEVRLRVEERHGVVGALEVGDHVVRGSAREPFDARKVDDGFIELYEDRIDEREHPAVVLAGVLAR